MRFAFDARFDGRTPIEVLQLFRDGVPRIAAKLPNAAKVEVLEARPDFTRLKWHGRGEIPGPAKHLVDPEDLFWFEETTWDEDGLAAATVIHRPGVGNVRCSTYVAFTRNGTGSYAKMEGEITISIPLLGPLLERYAVKKIEENLRASVKELTGLAPEAVALKRQA
jgi:hypothetical protein